MTRLSREAALTFKGKGNHTTLKVDRNKLLNELGFIADMMTNSSEVAFNKWSMSCEAMDKENQDFSCTLTTSHEKIEDIKLILRVNANGDSYLEAILDNENTEFVGLLEQIKCFMKSPAAKRYFETSVQGIAKIKARIPKREIVSRYFGEYVRHLLQQLEPIINMMVSHKLRLQPININ